jgi:hypothetical protein
MIIDTSFIEPLYQAEKKKTYTELFDYVVGLNFDEKFYKKMGIYYEEYQYGATSFLYVPISIKFLLYYLRGKDYNDKYSYSKAYRVFNQDIANSVRWAFSKEFDECTKWVDYTGKYDQKYGTDRAKQIKNKISSSMRRLDKKIIAKRNESIRNYASNRPENHNIAISTGRKKKIIDIKTKHIYEDAAIASAKTGICLSYIRQSCKGKRNLGFYYLNEYEEFTKDLI